MDTKRIFRLIAGIVLPVLFYVAVMTWTNSGEHWFAAKVAPFLPFSTHFAVFLAAFVAWIGGMAITYAIFDSHAAMMRWVSGLLLATEEYAQVHGPRSRRPRLG